jgi:hypothetical protein
LGNKRPPPRRATADVSGTISFTAIQSACRATAHCFINHRTHFLKSCVPQQSITSRNQPLVAILHAETESIRWRRPEYSGEACNRTIVSHWHKSARHKLSFAGLPLRGNLRRLRIMTGLVLFRLVVRPFK